MSCRERSQTDPVLLQGDREIPEENLNAGPEPQGPEHYTDPSHPSFISSSQFKCCGSNSSADWQHSTYILSQEAQGRRVPDSCCKTVVAHCGQRAHPSNIYKVEVSAEVI